MVDELQYFDSHAHLDSIETAAERDAVICRARQAGVSRIVAVGGFEGANAIAVQLAEKYPGHVFAAVGYDRELADKSPSLVALEECLGRKGVCSVGEVGLDYYYHPDSADSQKELFRRMLQFASARQLPVIVHSRAAEADTLAMLREHVDGWSGDPLRVGVLHCFTGDEAFAQQILDLGLMISLSAIFTFKNADALRRVAVQIPEDRLLIETDSPYLAPAPYRGKKNEPAYLPIVAERLAEIRGSTPAEIAAVTRRNAENLFGLGLMH